MSEIQVLTLQPCDSDSTSSDSDSKKKGTVSLQVCNSLMLPPFHRTLANKLPQTFATHYHQLSIPNSLQAFPLQSSPQTCFIEKAYQLCQSLVTLITHESTNMCKWLHSLTLFKPKQDISQLLAISCHLGKSDSTL